MNITEVLSDIGIDFCRSGEHHHVRDGWLGIDCPWCPPPIGGKGRYRLGVEISSGRVNCWVCGRHSMVEVLVEAGKMSYRAAIAALKDVKLAKFVPTKTSHVSGKLSRPNNISPMIAQHRQYLEGRGFDADEIERLWNVQGIGLSVDLKWRLFIPITFNGAEVSWTTRSISNKSTIKYISASPEQEIIHLKDIAYGIDLVRTTIAIVEGAADVWNVGPGAAAIFGLNYTPAQIELISRFPWRVVCFDNEVEAQRRARDLCETLSLFPGRTSNICLDAADPGSAPRSEIRRFRRAVFDS